MRSDDIIRIISSVTLLSAAVWLVSARRKIAHRVFNKWLD